MPSIRRSKVISYTPVQMYTLVNDVESYAQFIPHCSESHVISCVRDEIHAKLAFSRGGLHKSFETINRAQPHKMIEIRLVSGPFKRLEGFWKFEGMENGACRVSLDLEFEFASRLLAIMFGPFFNQVASMLVESFCKRADAIYGKKI